MQGCLTLLLWKRATCLEWTVGQTLRRKRFTVWLTMVNNTLFFVFTPMVVVLHSDTELMGVDRCTSC